MNGFVEVTLSPTWVRIEVTVCLVTVDHLVLAKILHAVAMVENSTERELARRAGDLELAMVMEHVMAKADESKIGYLVLSAVRLMS